MFPTRFWYLNFFPTFGNLSLSISHMHAHTYADAHTHTLLLSLRISVSLCVLLLFNTLPLTGAGPPIPGDVAAVEIFPREPADLRRRTMLLRLLVVRDEGRVVEADLDRCILEKKIKRKEGREQRKRRSKPRYKIDK